MPQGRIISLIFPLRSGYMMKFLVWSCYFVVILSCWPAWTVRLEYTLPSQLAGHTYELEVGLRHTENYPYQDIWLEVLYPLSPDRRPDTLHLSLSDKWGNWNGKGTAGNMYQFTCTQDHPLHLSPADSLLQVVHIMRDKSLKGISDVGMRLSTFTGSVNTQKNKQ